MPTHSVLDSYVSIGRSQLSPALNILRYLDTLDPENFSIEERQRLVAFCLSASYFSVPIWKSETISIGEKLNAAQGDELLSARLSLRKRELSRLCPSQVSRRQPPTKVDITPGDAIANSILGEQILLEVQEMIDRDQLSQAWSILDRWKPWQPTASTTEPCASIPERHIRSRIIFLQAKICRFSGHFRLARTYLESIFNSPCTRIVPLAFSTLIAVLCELGDFQAAKVALYAEQNDDRYVSWIYPSRERRLQIASAQIHLMEGLWAFKSNKHAEARFSLQTANKELKELLQFYQEGLSPTTLATSVNHFSVLTGLAIIAHLQCDLSTTDQQLEEALSCWKSCQTFANECLSIFGWDLSFTHTIFLYSQSHIMLRQGRRFEATNYANEALQNYLHTGCQTYWLALGTLWQEILEKLHEHENGMVRISVHRVVQLEEPCTETFPFAVNSTRPVV